MKNQPQSSFKGLTRRTKVLLSRPEGFDVEFKRNVNGVSVTALIAFANSTHGGTILAGVDDDKGKSGEQIGKVVGCKVGDREKLQVLGRAANCVPPVEVLIYIENLAKKPIMRIEIESGTHKPYCTRRGTYKLRGDGRTNAILPTQLLSMFMEHEGDAFLRRFMDATDQMRSEVVEEFDRLVTNVASMETRITRSLKKVFDSAAHAESVSTKAMFNADDTIELLETTKRKVRTMENELSHLMQKMDTLLRHFHIRETKRR